MARVCKGGCEGLGYIRVCSWEAAVRAGDCGGGVYFGQMGYAHLVHALLEEFRWVVLFAHAEAVLRGFQVHICKEMSTYLGYVGWIQASFPDVFREVKPPVLGLFRWGGDVGEELYKGVHVARGS